MQGCLPQKDFKTSYLHDALVGPFKTRSYTLRRLICKFNRHLKESHAFQKNFLKQLVKVSLYSVQPKVSIRVDGATELSL